MPEEASLVVAGVVWNPKTQYGERYRRAKFAEFDAVEAIERAAAVHGADWSEY